MRIERRTTINLLAALCVVLLVTLLAGCGSKTSEADRILNAPIEVDVHLDENADFSSYGTWRWIPAPQNIAFDPYISSQEVKTEIEEAVQNELFTKGYVKDDEKPDFLLNFHVATNKIDQEYINTYYSGNFPQYQMDMKAKEWDEGTLILFIFDTRSQQLVWQGTARAEIMEKGGMPLDKRRERLTKAVAQMMKDLPSRSG